MRYAQETWDPSELGPLELGEWGVQVFFQDSTGKDRAGVPMVVKIKATSFNVTPETSRNNRSICNDDTRAGSLCFKEERNASDSGDILDRRQRIIT